MTEKTIRRPVGNFFIKKKIQVTIIAKILFIVLVLATLTTLMLAWVYNAKSQAGSFYYMSNNIMEDLKLQSVLGLVLPAVLIAQFVTIVIAVGIGLFSSRKVAVPLYKIEKWADQLSKGNLKTRLAFRETREMRELTDRCNAVADTYRSAFHRIDEVAAEIEQAPANEKQVRAAAKKLREVLADIQYRE